MVNYLLKNTGLFGFYQDNNPVISQNCRNFARLYSQHPILNFEQADNFILAYYAGGDTEPKGLPFEGEPEIEPEPGAFNKQGANNQIIQNVNQRGKYNINIGQANGLRIGDGN